MGKILLCNLTIYNTSTCIYDCLSYNSEHPNTTYATISGGKNITYRLLDAIVSVNSFIRENHL